MVSQRRAEAVTILLREFSVIPELPQGKKQYKIISELLGIKPETVDRYIRGSGYRARYSKITLLDAKDTLSKYRNQLDNRTRAVMALERNGFTWTEMGNLFKIKPDSIKRYYKRKLARKVAEINI